MLLHQPVKVGLARHVGEAELVLDRCRGADVLVEELLPRLLGDGFGRHVCKCRDMEMVGRGDRLRTKTTVFN